MTGPMDSVPIMLAEYSRRRARILAGLSSISGVTCTQPAGAFYAFPDVSAQIGKRLGRRHRSGSSFHGA